MSARKVDVLADSLHKAVNDLAPVWPLFTPTAGFGSRSRTSDLAFANRRSREAQDYLRANGPFLARFLPASIAFIEQVEKAIRIMDTDSSFEASQDAAHILRAAPARVQP